MHNQAFIIGNMLLSFKHILVPEAGREAEVSMQLRYSLPLAASYRASIATHVHVATSAGALSVSGSENGGQY
jgi:hypothetical protein